MVFFSSIFFYPVIRYSFYICSSLLIVFDTKSHLPVQCCSLTEPLHHDGNKCTTCGLFLFTGNTYKEGCKSKVAV
jgi:hypothetical protein